MGHIAIAQPAHGPHATSSPQKAPRRSSRPLLAIETPRLILRAHDAADPEVVGVTILLKPGLAEAGWMRFTPCAGVAGEVELGFFLEPSCRGRGLMREAARAALPQVLRLLGARTLCAMVPADAPAAESVARSLGLVASSRRGAMRRFEKDLCGLI